jgi:hypothetical protein
MKTLEGGLMETCLPSVRARSIRERRTLKQRRKTIPPVEGLQTHFLTTDNEFSTTPLVFNHLFPQNQCVSLIFRFGPKLAFMERLERS